MKLATILLVVLLAGCATVSPDPRLIVWDRPNTEAEADKAAAAIYGAAFPVADTHSMEPFLYGGDFIVVDFQFPYYGIGPGMLPVYDPNWADQSVPLVCHMSVERTGDAWIVTGINNRYSESGSRAMTEADYRGMCVQVFTARKKP